MASLFTIKFIEFYKFIFKNIDYFCIDMKKPLAIIRHDQNTCRNAAFTYYSSIEDDKYIWNWPKRRARDRGQMCN